MNAEIPGDDKIERANQTPGEALFAQLKKEAPPEYADLINFEVDNIRPIFGNYPFVDYVSQWVFRHPEHRGSEEEWAADKHILEEKLVGAPLVDLGSGNDMQGYGIAKKFKANAYIGVDLTLHDSSMPIDPLSYDKKTYELTRGEGVECMLVRADMLDFVSRLPDNSANFMINGLDCLQDVEHQETVAKEIVRALKPGGVVFGLNNGSFTLNQDLWAQRDSMPGYTLIFHKLSTSPEDFIVAEKVAKA